MRQSILLCLLLLSNFIAYTESESPLKIFLNCKEDCYEDYLKQELTSFSFVRDRFTSDIEILIIRQESANNGSFFTLEFIGREPHFSNKRSIASFTTNAGDTQDIIREKMLKHIKLGLFKLLMDSVWEKYFSIETSEEIQTSAQSAKDKWNYWVFTPGMEGYIEGESNYSFRELKGYFNVRRITVKNKFLLSAEYANKFQKYVLDSTLALGINYIAIKPQYSYSLTRHWTLGVLGNYSVDQYRNIHTGLKAAPVIEYNLFPIEVNSRKQFRIAYQAGVQHWKYYLPTVFDRKEEVRPYHKLSVISEIVQPWGSIRSSLNANTYLDDFSQNRFNLDILLSFRLFKGFTMNVEGQAAIINDQISLVKEALDDNVYLLGGQQLPTYFNYWTSFGFSYTFGSVHNTIVNPRLGQVE